MEAARRVLAVALMGLMGLAGCASDPRDIEAQHVTPTMYKDFDCEQISAELQRVSRRTSELFARLDETRSDDEVQTAVGVILLWPLLFLEGGDGVEAEEYARLQGEINALEAVAIVKECDMTDFEEIREKQRAMREASEAKEKAEE